MVSLSLTILTESMGWIGIIVLIDFNKPTLSVVFVESGI